jgi:hypothetical protein
MNIPKFKVGDILEYKKSSSFGQYRKVTKLYYLGSEFSHYIMDYFWDKECTNFITSDISNCNQDYYKCVSKNKCKYCNER